jgi:3-oxoacyl-[acyl-carrier protein] reductase
MSTDLYAQLVNSPPGRLLAPRLGLPQPPKLDRYEPGAPVVSGAVLVGAAPGGRLSRQLGKLVDEIGATRANET